MVAAILVAVALALGIAGPIAAITQPSVRWSVSFEAGCTGTGYQELFNQERPDHVQRHAVEWTSSRPIESHRFLNIAGNEDVVFWRLIGADGKTVLFEAPFSFAYNRRFLYELDAHLDCSTIPYRLALPGTDTTALPATGPAAPAMTPLLVAIGAVLGGALALIRLRRSPTG